MKVSDKTDAPWQDKETLHKKYWGEEKSLAEIAEELGCSVQTVSNWMDKNGIEKRPKPGSQKRKFRDEDLLRKLYIEEKMSTLEIADKLDCSKYSVLKYMEKYGIETRESTHDKNGCYFTSKSGYAYFAVTQDYDTVSVPIHRLLAVATGELSQSNLFNGDINIHHQNNIQWDNRPSNIEAIEHSEHAGLHSKEREREKGMFN